MASQNILEIISKTRVVEEGYAGLNPSNEYETGCYHRVSHQSTSTKTKMVFGLFLPSSYKNDGESNTPVMVWLSGLTCDDTNFAMKAGSRAFEAAEKHVSMCRQRNIHSFVQSIFISRYMHNLIQMC
jgi:S-formylglutathione hydrolase FrmB